ncbi:MAG TPA: hypothetical protein PLN96_05245 [Zoogloea sp.]|nr:hypothetical protein [Zoogloea sp.]HNA67256.1 hypothetical protein [Rhodocyclaceae bacterium]HNI47242.1 hypothetical protein [Zoogloea sp.]
MQCISYILLKGLLAQGVVSLRAGWEYGIYVRSSPTGGDYRQRPRGAA